MPSSLSLSAKLSAVCPPKVASNPSGLSLYKMRLIKAVVSGYSPNWFQSNVVYKRDDNINRNYVTTVGDVFGLWFANKNRIAHVGFIDSRQGDYYITVEGNTNEAGSREGDGVYKKRRHVKTIYAISRWIK
jgi:hypothetical protein